jgi:hypothetical protein
VNVIEKRMIYGTMTGATQALMDVLHAHGVPTFGCVIAINIGDEGLLVVGGAPGDPLERARLMSDLHRDAPLAVRHWADTAKAATVPMGELPEKPFEVATQKLIADTTQKVLTEANMTLRSSDDDDGGAA